MGWRAGAGIACLLLAANVATAEADTDVSGDRDSNAPLIIDPSTNPTDALTTGITWSAATVKFIQRMPVTKVVNQITIGDIGQAASCTTPTRTRLYVKEHEGDPEGEVGSDFSSGQQITYSSGHVALPSSPGKVTYTIPPTAFRAGRGYSLAISADYSGTDCKAGRQTTWAHNDAQVNAGPALCTGAPKHKRMWHAEGLDDANAFCVTRPPGTRTFDPTMPTGWLVSRSASSNWDMMSGTYPSNQGIPSTACSASGSNPLAFGAGPVFWRVHPQSNGTSNEYTCRWGQFADHGQTVDDGWYYAQPWLAERVGSPRDMYLKLDTIDYGALLAAHSPILKYDSGETFHAISPGAMTDLDDSPSGGYSLSDAFVSSLRDSSGDEIAAAGSPGPGNGPWPPVLVLGTLGEHYWFGPDPQDQPAASSTDYVDPRGTSTSTYEADAALMASSPGYADKVYGRIVHGGEDGPGGEMDGRLWLQYWTFYYHNPIELLEHEGDWEMVQIGLDSAYQPEVAVYSQHEGGQVCDWDEVEVSGLHPVVYVAEGSHASYFGPERIPTQHIYDHADGLGGVLASPDLDEIATETPRWVDWPGSWGSASNSPKGPQFQSEKWSDPTAWKSGLGTC